MAIINKNDSDKLFGILIRETKFNTRLSAKNRDRIVKYLIGIKKGTQVNDFIDEEILAKVIMVANNPDFNDYNLDDYLKTTLNGIKHLLPYGKKTEDFEKIKEELLIHYLGEDGIFTKNLFNSELCSLFDDKADFFEIMNIIANGEDYKDYLEEIVDFGVGIGKEIDDSKLLKREIMSFIHDVPYTIEDVDQYLEDRIIETRMKYGIYPGLDEQSVSEISREVEKARSILLKLEGIEKKVQEYSKYVDKKTIDGKKELEDKINVVKSEIKSELDEYLNQLEESLKNSSDAVFNEILENAREKIKEIRIATNNLGSSTTKELIRIRQEAEKSVDRLKTFVEGSDELKETIAYARNNDDIINGILAISGNGGVAVPTVSAPAVIVDNSDDEFLKANYKMTEGVLPAFDSSIPFDKRLRIVEENIKKMEANGYLVPSTIYEALPWYMQGNKIVYLYGPAQSGKTTLAELLTKAVGTELIDGGKISEEHSVTSFNDVRGKFDENQLYYGLYYGKTVMYDEFDTDNPKNIVLLGTYTSQLSNKIKHPEKDVRVTFAKRRLVPINVNARIITLGNTTGKGRNREYTERSRFDESTHQRIVYIFVDYNKELEKRIFKEKTEWLNFFNFFRQSCIDYAKSAEFEETEGNLTTNDASTIVDIVDNESMSVSSVMRGLFVQIKEDEYLDFLINRVREKYGIDEDEIEIEKLNNIPLKKMKTQQIAQAFIYEAKNKNKGYVKRR